MRALLLLCAVGCIAGAAAAQNAPSIATAFNPIVEPLQEGVHVFPAHAMEQGASGAAFLCCSAKADRSLDCRVGSETPQHFGFGDAAMRFASNTHLTTQSYTELQTRASKQFALSVRFQVLPPAADADAVALQARASATDVCGPGTGPAPDYVTVSGQSVMRTPGGGTPGAHHSHGLGGH